MSRTGCSPFTFSFSNTHTHTHTHTHTSLLSFLCTGCAPGDWPLWITSRIVHHPWLSVRFDYWEVRAGERRWKEIKGISILFPPSPSRCDLSSSYTYKVKWKSLSYVHYLPPHGLYSPWNSPGQNTGVGSFSLFQGIFPTQGSNPGLPHRRQILYQLSHKGSPLYLRPQLLSGGADIFWVSSPYLILVI